MLPRESKDHKVSFVVTFKSKAVLEPSPLPVASENK